MQMEVDTEIMLMKEHSSVMVEITGKLLNNIPADPSNAVHKLVSKITCLPILSHSHPIPINNGTSIYLTKPDDDTVASVSGYAALSFIPKITYATHATTVAMIAITE